MEQNKSKVTTKFGKGNPGKPKGALTHTTRTAKEAIALAAEGLGGASRLVTWAQEDPVNERVFWGTIYPKLLPLQVNAAVEVSKAPRDMTIAELQAAIASIKGV